MFPVMTTKNVCRHCQKSFGVKIACVWELLSYRIWNFRTLLNLWVENNQAWIYIESEKCFYFLGFMLEWRKSLWSLCLKCLGWTLSALPSSVFSPRPHCVHSDFMTGHLVSGLYPSLCWDSSTVLIPDSLIEQLITYQLLPLWMGSCSLHKSLLPELLFKSRCSHHLGALTVQLLWCVTAA